MVEPQPFRATDFLSPRHWPTWLGLGVMRLAVFLPWSLQLRLGNLLGDLTYRLIPSRRSVADINLRHCFPELSAQQRKHLVRATFRASAISIFEGGMSWWGSDRRLQQLHRIEGLEHLEAARAEGRGVILLGGHYTTLEISGRFLAFHVEGLQPIYKPAHNPLFEAVLAHSRKRLFDDLLSNSDMRTIIRNLKRGKVVWYAPDQDFGRKSSVFAPFFGVQTATLTTTARMARLSKSPVVPYTSERLADGRFVIRLQPALAEYPSGNDLADATRTNRIIEEQVRRVPEQYLWVHKRFKTRPQREERFY